MAHRVCPWWLGYALVVPLRRLVQDPAVILAPHVAPGMTVLEPGAGMGYFTLELARRVGPSGKVVAVDVQPRMLSSLARRAGRAGLAERVETRVAKADGLGLEDLAGKVDFALLFAMVHEVPDPARFLAEIGRALGPGRRALLAEPQGHVRAAAFEQTLAQASAAGLEVESRPQIWRSHAALLRRT